ncbi:hypothetical protein HAX54_022148, partial [Datura stramonium]|nr:hypothetical protein [Datura stramonium]
LNTQQTVLARLDSIEARVTIVIKGLWTDRADMPPASLARVSLLRATLFKGSPPRDSPIRAAQVRSSSPSPSPSRGPTPPCDSGKIPLMEEVGEIDEKDLQEKYGPDMDLVEAAAVRAAK